MSMPQQYFISDLHIGHQTAIDFRLQDMASLNAGHDQLLMDNISEIMLSSKTRKHTLWLGGDDCVTTKGMDFLEYLLTKGCRINKLLGNHDTENKEKREELTRLLPLCNQFHGLVKMGEFWISHAPIHPCHLRGRKNIHGHLHEKTIIDPNYVNISAENVMYKPVSLSEIRSFTDHNQVFTMRKSHDSSNP